MKGGIHLFPTFDDFVDRASSNALPDWGERHSRRDGRGKSWDLGASFEDAAQLARDGWSDGRKRIERVRGQIRQSARKQGRRAGYRDDYAGLFPNVGAFASGRPDCMVNRARGVSKLTSVVRLTVQLSASADCDAAHMANYGAAVVALVDALIRRGDSVDVFAALDVGDGYRAREGQGATIRVNVKRPGRTIDPGRLMFMIAHPAAFRRLGFGVYETIQWFIDEGYRHNYGYPAFHKTEHDGIRILNSAQRYKATTFEQAYTDVVEQHNEQSTDKVKA
jgi:hypothetical protein